MKKKFYKKIKITPPPKKSSKKIKRSTIGILIFTTAVLNILLLSVFIFLLVLIKFTSVKNINAQESQTNFSYFIKRPDLLSSSKALVVYEINSKVMLLSKNKDLRFSPASTAKVMSALVALEALDLNTILTTNSIDTNPDISKMGLFLGEKISVKNLLYGMLLPSGGDAATVLSQNYPGGAEAFVKRMNEKAQAIGMKNTSFFDPAGYDDRNYSTATDLARLGAEALKNPLISNIIKTKTIIVYDETGRISHKLTNLNELLDIPGVNGVKTGFTNEAEGVLITSFKNDGQTFVIVVLGSKDRFSDTRMLIQGILEDLKSE